MTQIGDPNLCNDPEPNGGMACVRPLGHHVLTDHWNGVDSWPASPSDEPRKFGTLGEALDDLAERSRFDADDLAAVAPDAGGSDADLVDQIPTAELLKVYRSKRWKITRTQFLEANPWCSHHEAGRRCPLPATDVDHVTRLRIILDEGRDRPGCAAY
jgi:hypothetical protein